jgi:1-acyl-sn-glycerol-3-phosphate acyltransferase
MGLMYTFIWVFMNFVTRVFFRIKIVNGHNIPSDGAFILASNHISLADPPILGGATRRPVHFMAKKELFENPLFGRLLRNISAFPVDRSGPDRAAMKEALSLLKAGQPVAMFPEGTRGRDGEFLKAQAGVGMIARKSEVPIVPVYMTGSNRLRDCFWGREKLCVIYGKAIDSETVQAYDTGKEGYLRLSEDIMSRIKSIKREHLLEMNLSHQEAG